MPLRQIAAISEATPLHVHETVLPEPYGWGIKTIRQLNDMFKTIRIWVFFWTGDEQADGLVVTPAFLAPPSCCIKLGFSLSL